MAKGKETKDSEKIKLKIEHLESQKENLKFGYSQFSFYFLSLLVFFGTLSVSAMALFTSTQSKINMGVSYIILMSICFIVFRKPLNDRARKLKDIAKEIDGLYSELLKENDKVR